METTSTIRKNDATGEPSAREAFSVVRQASLNLCAPLTVEDYSLQAMPDTSPAKWHLAHTTWFFETFLLSEYLPGYTTVNPAFRSLFNSYYNGVGDQHPRAETNIVPHRGGLQLRRNAIILDDTAVEQMHGAIRVLCEALIVRHHANGGTGNVQFP